MKTKYIFIPALCLAALISQAQIKQTRDISPFTKIDASGAATIYFQPSDSLALTVEGDGNEIVNIETRVHDNTLIIKSKGTFHHPFKVIVKGGQGLKELMLSGASNFISEGELKTDSLAIESSGASRLDMPLSARSIRATISGASDVSLWGNTTNLNANVSGASTLKAYKLNSINTFVTASGASTAKVFATEKISANATGASTIKFKGEPKEVSAEGSTSSQIAKVGGGEESSVKKGDKDSSSTTFNFGNKRVIILDNEDEIDSLHYRRQRNRNFRHWNGFYIGVAGYLTPAQSFTMVKPFDYMELDYSKCRNFQINLFQQNIHLIKNYLNLCTGIGFEFNQYQFANKVRLNPDSSFAWGEVDSTTTFAYKKNRLKSYYITAPVILEVNTSSNPRKAFHIGLGVVGKYLMGGRSKQVLLKDGNKFKNIKNDSYNINPFAVDAYASVGYGNFTIFAQYGLTEMFTNNKGPELYPFSVGIRVVNFN
jgi:hypothetical protein